MYMYMYIYIYIYIGGKSPLFRLKYSPFGESIFRILVFLRWEVQYVFWVSGIVFWVPKWAQNPGPIGGLLKSSLNP